MICIYAIINIVDDKFYVGQAADKDYRWREHRKQLRGFYHHNLYLQRAWSKHGEQNFIFVVLEVLDDTLKLNEREFYWAKTLNAEYNIAPAGKGMRGYKHTDKARQNMSHAHKGRSFHTENSKQLISEKLKGNSWNVGKKHSAEHIEARASSIRGKPKSDEHKAKLAASNRGKLVSEETRRKMSDAARRRKKALDENLKACSIESISSWSDL